MMKRATSLSVVAVALGVALAAAAQAQPVNWHYMYYKTSIPLTLDDDIIAVHDPDGLPSESVEGYLAAVGLDGFTMKPRKGGWYLFERSPASYPGREPAHALIQRISARPDSTFYLSPVFHGPNDPTAILYPSQEMSVAFREDLPPATAEAELHRAGTGPILQRNWLRTPNIFRLERRSRSGIDLLKLANSMALNPLVRFANPGFIVEGHLASCASVRYLPSQDPHYAESWAFQAMQFEAAHAICTGLPSVIVAILDDGIPFHPDLWSWQTPLSEAPSTATHTRGFFYEGTDCTEECVADPAQGCNSKCNTGLPLVDCDRHGAMVASVLSAAPANGMGSVGAAPGISVLPIRVGRYEYADPNDDVARKCANNTLEPPRVAEAIDYAARMGARVTVLSWQTAENFSEVTEAYQRTYENDHVVHFNSAGNDNRKTHPSPPGGSLDKRVLIGPVNSVSAVDESGALWRISNSGRGIDFAGPGAAIFVTDRTSDWTDQNDRLGFRLSGCDPAVDIDCCDPDQPDCYGGLFVKAEGTSLANPYVAAVAALIISEDPNLTAPQVEAIMKYTADDLGVPGYDTEFGHGRPNGEKALRWVREGAIFKDGFETGDMHKWSASQ